MKVTKEKLFETAGSLERFGQLKFKDKSLSWKIARIHRAATKINESIREDRGEMLQHLGVEVERKDMAGNAVKFYEIPAKSPEAATFKKQWDELMAESVEFWGDPIKPEDLPIEFWGRAEVKDESGKVTVTGIDPMMNTQDIGALGEWLISEE